MPQLLEHSPADILRWLLVSTGTVSDPAANADWPCYCSQEPNSPDRVVTTFDTDDRILGREQLDGGLLERFGVQIRVRSNRHTDGWAKSDSIRHELDREILRETITVGSSVYCVQSFRRTSGVIDLGKEVGASKRHLFTINGLLTVEKVS